MNELGAVDEESPLLQDDSRDVSQAPVGITAKIDSSSMILLLLGEFLSHAETTIMFTAAPQIASDLGDLGKASWLAAAYTLGVCSSQLLYSKLSDIFGRRNLLACGYFILTIGCIVCGFSTALWHIIIGRVISGLGGAGVMTMASIIITDSVSKREIAQYRSYINTASILGRSLGGPIGGYVLDKLSWQWLFWSRIPLLAISIVLLLCLLENHVPEKKNPDSTETRKVAKGKCNEIDFVGAILLCTSIVFTLLLINQAGGSKDSPLLFLSLGILGIIVPTFVYYERYHATNPVFDLEILRKPNTALSYLIVHLQVIAQVSLMFTTPLYFQVTQHSSTTASGLHLIPAVVANALGSLMSGWLIRSKYRFKSNLLSVGPISSITYFLLFFRWNDHVGLFESGFIIPAGLATGMAQSSSFISMAAFLEQKSMATATGMFFLVSSFGTAIGIASSNQIIQVFFRWGLNKQLTGPDASKIINEVTKNVNVIQDLDEHIRRVVVTVFVNAARFTYIFGFLCSIISSLLALMLRDVEL